MQTVSYLEKIVGQLRDLQQKGPSNPDLKQELSVVIHDIKNIQTSLLLRSQLQKRNRSPLHSTTIVRKD